MKNIIEIGDDTNITYIPDFISQESSKALFKYLARALEWRQDSYGSIKVPRLTSFMAAEGTVYKYSKLTHTGKGFDKEVAPLLSSVSLFSGEDFNSILLNYYRDDNDSIGFHFDNEPELGDNPIVAALSLGGPRVFTLKHKKKKYASVNLTLEDGSLVIMGLNCQRNWLHGINKNTGSNPRISLTFRRIINGNG